jgi:pimeloyl-ACP methyl ester carboxylesterase
MSVFANHLSQRFQVIAPDLRGYGQRKREERRERRGERIFIIHLFHNSPLSSGLVFGRDSGFRISFEKSRKIYGVDFGGYGSQTSE